MLDECSHKPELLLLEDEEDESEESESLDESEEEESDEDEEEEEDEDEESEDSTSCFWVMIILGAFFRCSLSSSLGHRHTEATDRDFTLSKLQLLIYSETGAFKIFLIEV